jgi:hypothetical protein
VLSYEDSARIRDLIVESVGIKSSSDKSSCDEENSSNEDKRKSENSNSSDLGSQDSPQRFSKRLRIFETITTQK